MSLKRHATRRTQIHTARLGVVFGSDGKTDVTITVDGKFCGTMAKGMADATMSIQAYWEYPSKLELNCGELA